MRHQRSPKTGILVITWNFPPRQGGIENLVSGLSRELKKSRLLFVITSFAASPYEQQDWIFRPKRPGLIPFFLYALCQGCLVLRKNPQLKIVVGGSALVIPLVVLLAKLFRRKAVLLVHGLDLIYPGFLYQTLCVCWIRYCDAVVANSHYTASLAEQKKARKDSIRVIPPAVDWELFVPGGARDAVKGELGWGQHKVLLYVGRLVQRKGVKEFLQGCFLRIAREVPDVCLVIAGENPSESLVHRADVSSELAVVVRDMELQDRVRLLGWVQDKELVKIYQASDLLVLPALRMSQDVEGFGLVILEAAAAGKPAVATRVGGIPDAIEDGKSGILVEPGDSDSMIRAIVSLLRDDARRTALGKYAKRRVQASFAWASVVEKYDALFESLVAGPRGG